MGSPPVMSVLSRNKKTKKAEAADWLTTALKAGAVGVAARGGGKVAKKGGKKVAKKGAKRAAVKGGKGAGRRIAPFVAIGAVGLLVAKKLRGSRGTEVPGYDASSNGSVTPEAPPVSTPST